MVENRNKSIITKAMKFRDKVGDNSFYDMNFETLIKDIPGSVQKVRTHFNMPHTKDHEMAVHNILNAPRKDKPGKHKYSPQQFGLNPEGIINRFSEYIERFNIKV